MNKNVCILVSSPDSYNDVFEISSKLLIKNWPNCPYKKYYSTDHCSHSFHNGFNVMLFPERDNWVERVIDSVKLITEDYIFLLTDDLFLYKRIDGNHFEVLLDYMIKNKTQYCRLYRNDHFKSNKNQISDDIYTLHYNQSYAISLLGAIWEREHLLNFLQGSPKNAWELERNIQKEFLNKGNLKIENHIYYHNDIFFHAVYKGKWMRKVNKILIKNNMELLSTRKKISMMNSMTIFLKRYFRDMFNPNHRTILKRLLSKIIYFDSKY